MPTPLNARRPDRVTAVMDYSDAGLVKAWRLAHRRRWEPTTALHRERQIRRLARWVADRGSCLAEVSDDLLQDYIEQLAVGADAQANTVSAIKGFYTYLRRARVRIDNPADMLERDPVPERGSRDPGQQEVHRVLQAARPDLERYAQLRLMRFAGFRCIDVARLHTDNVRTDVAGQVWLDIIGKGSRARSVPLDWETAKALEPFIRSRGHVFTDEDGQPYTAADISRRTNRFIARQGLRWTAHCLRHAFVNGYADEDPDNVRASTVAGHKSLDTIRVYRAARSQEIAHFVQAAADVYAGRRESAQQATQQRLRREAAS